MTGYVLTGGTEAFRDELAGHLGAPARQPPAEDADAWVHVLPGEPGVDETRDLMWAVREADAALGRGRSAGFLAVVPVWGVLGSGVAKPVELAAAAARALAQVNVESWSAAGRRINVLAYGPLATSALPGMRDPGLLAARTPMHRPAGLAELANAIDFLSSAAAAYITGTVLPMDGGWTAYSWFHPARDL